MIFSCQLYELMSELTKALKNANLIHLELDDIAELMVYPYLTDDRFFLVNRQMCMAI